MSKAAEIASAYVAVHVQMPGVKRDIEKAFPSEGEFKNRGKRIGGVISGAIGGVVALGISSAVGMITSSIGAAVRRVDTMNNFPKIMANLGYSASDAEKSIKKMSDKLSGLPTSLDSMTGAVTQLAPLTGSLDEATNISLALNNALLAGGKATDIQANAMEQYVQMLSVGKVDMAAWRSLVTAMPGQMGQLSESLIGAGASTTDLYDAMQNGTVSFADFNQALLELNENGVGKFASFEEQAKSATEGIATGWENLKTAISRNVATIIDRLQPMIMKFTEFATMAANQIAPIAITIIEVAESVWAWAEANSGWLIPVAGVIAALIAGYRLFVLWQAAIRTLTLLKAGWAAATYGSAAASYTMGGASLFGAAAQKAWTVATKVGIGVQKAFNMVLRANPIGLVITAVTLLVGALVWFFTETEIGQKIWSGFMDWLATAWEWLQEMWSAGLEFVTGLWESAWNAVKNVFTSLWDGITGKVKSDLEYWTKVFETSLMIVKTVWETAWNAVKSFFTNLWSGITNWFTQRLEYWKRVFRIALGILSEIWSNVWDAIRTKFSNIWNAIKFVFDTMIGFVKDKPVAAFQAARDAIGAAWDGLREKAKKPVKFVIETVVNGLIGTLNKLPGVDIKKVKLPKGFAVGGYTGNLPANAIAGVVHGDEHVIRAKSRRALEAAHPGMLDYMNRYGKLPGYAKGGLVHPLPNGRLTAGWFGYPGHRGMDFAAATGARIRAAGAGTVTHRAYDSSYGNRVDLAHANGLVTRYAHMVNPAPVTVGQKLKQRQLVGYVGSTGWSTGPHLHYEVIRNGKRVNPSAYLSGGGDAGVLGGSNLLDGVLRLGDWVAETISAQFKNPDMFQQMASGVVKSVVSTITSFGRGKIEHGGPTLFDTGGWLNPGMHLVENRTGKPEPVLTSSQWESLSQREQAIYVQNPFTGNYLLAKLDERADDAVDRGFEDQERAERTAAWR